MDRPPNSLSTYHLMFELLHDGKGHLYPNLEPFDVKSICDELQKRTGQNLGSDTESWVEWFLASTDAATPDERATIATVQRIRKIEEESLKKLGLD